MSESDSTEVEAACAFVEGDLPIPTLCEHGCKSFIPVDGRFWCSVGLAESLASLRRERDVARTERDRLAAALADCVVKSTNYGEQDGGFVAFYISPTGPIHRAIPLLAEFGITVRPGFDGRTCRVAGALTPPVVEAQ